MNRKAVFAAALALLPAAAVAEIVFYSNSGFGGRTFTARKDTRNFDRAGFNDRASSVIVYRERWEVCEHARYEGRCVVLRPGRYSSLGAMGMNDRISSARIVSRHSRVDDNRYAPPPSYPLYDSRRRGNERLYEADVVAVRAVYGRPEQRCWVEREQVGRMSEDQAGAAVLGAIIGGVLGHQVGSGRGKDAATVGGAAAGAMLGANIARDSSGKETYSRDVKRCSTVPGSGRPEYWDVTYVFRGREYYMQTTYPPGRTVTVNRRGEPRG